MGRKKYRRLVMSVLGIIVFSFSTPGFGQEKENISTKDIKEMVDLLENPQKREAFVKDLKNLKQLKEATPKGGQEKEAKQPEKERKILLIENLFVKFESLAGKVMEAATSSASLVAKTPEAFRETKSFLSQSENLLKLIKLVGDLACGIIIAFIISLFLRRYILKINDHMTTLTSKVTLGLLKVVLTLVPYGVLLASLFILFKILPSFPKGHSLSLLFFTILFFYRVGLEVFRVLLSPDEARIRLLSLSDEYANYGWVWILRFANYTAFYALVTWTLLVVNVSVPVQYFIRGILLLVFPFMISMFIMQVAREFSMKYRALSKKPEVIKASSNKIISYVVRYWYLLVIVYCWTIFLFLMVHYEKGFGYLFKATLGTAIAVLALFPALKGLDWLFKKFFDINARVKERFPGLEDKTNRYILILRKIFKAIILIMAIGIIAQIWGIPISKMVASKTGTLIIFRVIAIFITIGLVIGVIETSQFLKDYSLKGKKKGKKKSVSQKKKTLVPMINTAIKIAAGFIGGIVILDQLGVNTTPILAGAGIVGLAVGFGAQTLVKDLINGLFILFEESIRVGDYTDLGKNQGIVEAVGLRTIRLRDVSGNVHVVPNSSIDTITNMSKEFSRTVLDIAVAYKEDVDEVMEIMREIGEGMRNDPEIGSGILEPIEIFGLQKFDDSAVVIRARLTTKPLKQWGLKREFNRRLKKTFDERGIEIPFPHRTVYMGEPKEGPSSPLHIRMQEQKQ
jgi:small-conductance mechanosensitive channel